MLYIILLDPLTGEEIVLKVSSAVIANTDLIFYVDQDNKTYQYTVHVGNYDVCRNLLRELYNTGKLDLKVYSYDVKELENDGPEDI